MNDFEPQQVSLFDSLENRCVYERERERERVRLRHVYDDIISVENLLLSWREFLRDKKNRLDVMKFGINFSDEIFRLHLELINKSYRHGKYEAFKVNDPKPRDIHKASVRDRLVHHAICRIIYPYFDRKFIYDSYSCRDYKGTHRAMNRFRYFFRKVSRNNTRTCWILKCDISKFFASINHDILKAILSKHVADENVLWLFGQVIDSFHAKDKIGIGLPLGNLTSQLFVNIYMNKFDHFVKRKLKMQYYIRYADDFVFLSEDKTELEEISRIIISFLRENLNLSLNFNKVHISTYSSGIDFLGWVHFSNHRTLRTVTKKRMLANLVRNDEESTKASYLGLLSHGNAYKLKQRIMKINSRT